MGLIAWIVAGGIIGWLASIIMGRNQQMHLISNILAGIVGAFIGGVVWNWITGGAFSMAFNLTSFLVALVGAIVVLAVWNLFFGNK
ncbi:MAG: GlsB/YeaQ/YmgE family stress response membrane protein [Chloroflexota bacterium]